jgi:hypothetical protein
LWFGFWFDGGKLMGGLPSPAPSEVMVTGLFTLIICAVLWLHLTAESNGVVMIPNSEDFCFAVLPKSSSTIDEAEGVSSFFSNSVDDIACSVVMRAADNFVAPFSPNSGSDGFDDILSDSSHGICTTSE